MKILIVTGSYHPYNTGGGEHSIRKQAVGLSSLGHDVVVLTCFRSNKIEEIDGLKVIRIKHPNLYWSYDSSSQSALKKLLWHIIESFNPVTYFKLRAIIRTERPDVVQVRNPESFSSSLYLAIRRSKIPQVFTVNSYISMCAKVSMHKNHKNCESQCIDCRILKAGYKVLTKNLDAVVGVSEFILNKHVANGYFGNSIKKVIYTEEPYKKLMTESREGQITFGFIGRISPEKGIDIIFEAINILNSEHGIDVKFIVAGGNFEELKEKHHFLEARNQISYMGQVNPDDFYNNVDVVIISSLWHEPFPRVLVESHSHALPVITSNTGGSCEKVLHGKTGYVYESKNYNQLASIMKRIIEDPTILTTLGANILNNRADSPTDIESYSKLYHEITS